MSVITEIYDAVDLTLSSLLSATHKELVNPYIPELNDSLSLNRGYAFRFGSAFNTNRNLSCKFSVEREIVIVNTIVNRGTDRDKSIRKNAEKQLLEDQITIISQLEKEPSIQEHVSKLEFSNDNGIEFIFEEKYNYLYIETSLSMEYFQNFI